MRAIKEEPGNVVPFRPRARPLEEGASSRQKAAFLELARKLWGEECVEGAASRLAPRLEVWVLERWRRRLTFAASWEEVFSEEGLRVPFTSHLDAVLAWAAEARSWMLLLEAPRGLSLPQMGVLLRREAPWVFDLKRCLHLTGELRAHGWVLLGMADPRRARGLYEITFPKTLTATLFDERGIPVLRSRKPEDPM